MSDATEGKEADVKSLRDEIAACSSAISTAETSSEQYNLGVAKDSILACVAELEDVKPDTDAARELGAKIAEEEKKFMLHTANLLQVEKTVAAKKMAQWKALRRLLGITVVGTRNDIDQLLNMDGNGQQMKAVREKWTAEAEPIDKKQVLKCPKGHVLQLVKDAATSSYAYCQHVFICDGDHRDGEVRSHFHIAPYFQCGTCFRQQYDRRFEESVGFGMIPHHTPPTSF